MKQIIILLLLLPPILLHAQDTPTPPTRFHIGVGAGLDYGGFGMRTTYVLFQKVGVFIGTGYNLNSLGCNAGAHYIIPAGKHHAYFTGMYGYNAVIVVQGDVEDQATYYGFSGGVGLQVNSSNRPNFWNFELLVPVRNSNFRDDMDMLKALGAQVRKPLPFAFSIGYHFRIK
jgi:hypothetical protein